MIEVTLTVAEIKTILEKLKHCKDKELYNKFWRIFFNNGGKI